MRLNDIVKQLKKEQATLEKQVARVNEAISAITGTNSNRRGRKMSAQARARIAAAQRKRWAKVRAAQKKSA